MRLRGAVRTTFVRAAALIICSFAGASGAAGLEAPRWVAQRFIAERSAVGLAWTAVPGATKYLILRRAEGEGEARQIAATPGLQFLDTAVARGVRYRYAVRAEGAGGTGPLSAEAEVLAQAPELVPPPPPRWTDLDPGTDVTEGAVARLLWASAPGAVSYNVYRRSAGEPAGEFQLRANVRESRFADTDVSAGARYEYRLGAVSKTGVEGQFSEVRAVVLAAPAAARPAREAGPGLRVRPSREAFVLRGDPRQPLKAPVDLVAGDDGTIFVLDNQVPGVFVFAPGGALLRVLGGPGVGAERPLRQPYGIALDAQGRVWVTDRRERSVIVAFDPATGRVLETVTFDAPARPEALERLTPRARGERPFALDVDFLPGGEMVVTDNTFGRVCVLGRGGALVREFGLPGDKPGEFNRPSKLAVDPEGKIFVLDAQNRRVQAFDGAGSFLFEIGRSPTMVGGFIGPSGIAWGADGSVLVADSPMATIQAFDRGTGAYRYHVGREDGAVAAGGMRPLWDVVTPAGLAFEPGTGRLWIGMPMAHALSVREFLPASGAAPP